MTETEPNPITAEPADDAAELRFAADLALTAAEPITIEPDRTRDEPLLLVVPKGHCVERIDPMPETYRLDGPERRRGTWRLDTLGSFIAWLNDDRHHTDHGSTALYVDGETITAILNGPNSDAGDGWGDYRAVFAPTVADEWKSWTAFDREYHDQDTFMEFVEEWAHTFTTPNSAEMLQLVSTFKAFQSVKFDRAVRTTDGAINFAFTDEINHQPQPGSIEFPNQITITVELFEGCPLVAVPARFRYRLRAGTVKFGYLLDRPADVRRKAIQKMVEQIEAETTFTVFAGKAPAAGGAA